MKLSIHAKRDRTHARSFSFSILSNKSPTCMCALACFCYRRTISQQVGGPGNYIFPVNFCTTMRKKPLSFERYIWKFENKREMPTFSNKYHLHLCIIFDYPRLLFYSTEWCKNFSFISFELCSNKIANRNLYKNFLFYRWRCWKWIDDRTGNGHN